VQSDVISFLLDSLLEERGFRAELQKEVTQRCKKGVKNDRRLFSDEGKSIDCKDMQGLKDLVALQRDCMRCVDARKKVIDECYTKPGKGSGDKRHRKEIKKILKQCKDLLKKVLDCGKCLGQKWL